MKLMIASLAVLLFTALPCQAVPITACTDTDSFVQRAQEILIAKCLGPVPDYMRHDNGLYPVSVKIVSTLKGDRTPGNITIATIFPMEAGKTYLLTSSDNVAVFLEHTGKSALATKFVATAEFSVVELPPKFRVEDLKGKKVAEQVQTVLVARFLKSRLDAAQKAYGETLKSIEQVKRNGDLVIPLGKPEDVYIWSIRWLNAEREMSDKKEDHIVALEGHVKRMKELQYSVNQVRDDGVIFSRVETAAVNWYRAEAGLWLVKKKAK